MLDSSAKGTTAEVERERLNSLINSMADGVIATDEKVNILLYNGAALNILDRNSSIRGLSLDSVINLIDKNKRPIDVRELVIKSQHTYCL